MSCNFVFRFALLSLCLWLSLVAGFDCVRHPSSIALLLFLVSAAIPSTVSKQQVEVTTLLDLPPLAASLAVALTLDRLPTAVILPASQPSLHY